MRFFAALMLITGCGVAVADEQQVQRALIQRDQQSAEFAAQVRGSQDRAALQNLHARQLLEAALPANQPMPDQRERMARERELVFSPPAVRPVVRARPPEPPLPLPGGPRHVVDPIPLQGPGY
ncbi:MAG: hypothetical protein ACREUS_05810 [Burkholderiales bacterium]